MRPTRKRNRLFGYDYSTDNAYFVTICVDKKICCFGYIGQSITDGGVKTILNNSGKIALKQWQWLGKQYPYVKLHSFVVMPNHIHGIIEIDQNKSDNSVKIKSLSELMGAYKTTSSKQIHLSGFPTFKWQKSFYDCIIRNDQAFFNIARYIENNPMNWHHDCFSDTVKSIP